MGRRSGGNATVLASEPGRAVPVDGDRVLSKYAWVRPIKRKTGAELLKAIPKSVFMVRIPLLPSHRDGLVNRPVLCFPHYPLTKICCDTTQNILLRSFKVFSLSVIDLRKNTFTELSLP